MLCIYAQYWLLFITSNVGIMEYSLRTVWLWRRWLYPINTLGPIQDGRHFADDIFTCIFVNENCSILVKFSLKYVRNGPIDNNRALVQIMAWRRSGDKPLSEPMMISLPTHICVTRPQWVKKKIVFCKTNLLQGICNAFSPFIWLHPVATVSTACKCWHLVLITI